MRCGCIEYVNSVHTRIIGAVVAIRSEGCTGWGISDSLREPLLERWVLEVESASCRLRSPLEAVQWTRGVCLVTSTPTAQVIGKLEC